MQQVNHWFALPGLNIFSHCLFYDGGGKAEGDGNGVGKRKVEARIARQPFRMSIYSQVMLRIH